MTDTTRDEPNPPSLPFTDEEHFYLGQILKGREFMVQTTTLNLTVMGVMGGILGSAMLFKNGYSLTSSDLAAPIFLSILSLFVAISLTVRTYFIKKVNNAVRFALHNLLPDDENRSAQLESLALGGKSMTVLARAARASSHGSVAFCCFIGSGGWVVTLANARNCPDSLAKYCSDNTALWVVVGVWFVAMIFINYGLINLIVCKLPLPHKTNWFWNVWLWIVGEKCYASSYDTWFEQKEKN